MSTDEVPEELWLDVFTRLPTGALRSIFSASRTFNRLSRPLVFAQFQLSVYGVPTGGEAIPHEKVERVKRRIDFWLSETTAPLVRSCWVLPIPPPQPVPVDDSEDEEPENSRWHDQPYAEYTPLDHFLGKIHCLSGLRSLRFGAIQVPENALASIHDLQSLQHLEMLPGWVCESEEPRGLSILSSERCRLSEISLSAYETGRNQMCWSGFFNMHHLRDLSLSANLGWIFWHNEALPQNFVLLLAKFPAVEDLGLEPCHSDAMFMQDEVPQDVQAAFMMASNFQPLSSLRKLRGTLEVLSLFLRDAAARALTHLELTMGRFHQSEVWIQELSTSATVTCVSLGLHSPDILALNTILKFFPRLTQLCLKIHTYLPVLPLLRDVLHSTAFPTNMTALVIDNNAFLPPPLTRGDNQAELEELRDDFITRFPALVFLWLAGDNFLVCRRQGVHDTVVTDLANDGPDWLIGIHVHPLWPFAHLWDEVTGF
ncbi:hypothetical protein C8F01DRAFT_1290979 [Mycena amicta]|nr:hypothetical protein C8F01DRAFT_1290979 [Mycena amicta]